MAVIGMLLSGTPASAVSGGVVVQAGPSNRGCNGSGFHGEVRFWYLYNGSYVYYVGRIEYRFLPRNNRDRGDVIWNDSRGPIISTDTANQDGEWHVLPGNQNGYYRSGRGPVTAFFEYDVFGPGDPECTTDPWSM